jgi:methyl-accepting chemotaxis protein
MKVGSGALPAQVLVSSCAMPADPSPRRLLRLLRRTAKTSKAGPARTTADESALWSAQERAVSRARDAGVAAQRIGSSVLRQRASIDSVTDRIRALSSRIGDAHPGFERIVDAFERLSIVALNAGLEGARLGEAQGRALSLVGDEVRAQAARGGDSARELAGICSRLAIDLGELESQMGLAQVAVSEMTQDSAAVVGAASEAETVLVQLGERMKKATGSDPEAVRAIAEAADRARALVSSLVALSGKVPRALLIGALAPALVPLTRLLADEAPDEDDTAE